MFTIFGHLCVCVTMHSNLNQKAMLFNTFNNCSLYVSFSLYLTTCWHDYTMNTFVASTISFSVQSACILPFIAPTSVVQKMLSTHNHHDFCQIYCLLYKFCLTEQSFFEMATSCGTTTTGFYG